MLIDKITGFKLGASKWDDQLSLDLFVQALVKLISVRNFRGGEYFSKYYSNLAFKR